jgi:voltage-gated potassium channel
MRNFLKELAESDEDQGTVGRHTLLLASLIGLFVALPILRATPGGGIRFSIMLSLVLIAAIYVNSLRPWTLLVGVFVGGGAIAATAVSEATGAAYAPLVSQSLSLLLLILTTLMMLNTLVRADRVSKDTIIGGICVYLMIGLSFAVAYLIILGFDADALIKAGRPLNELRGDASAGSAQVLYFSFVTLTTLGFGDIAPAGEIAQTVVVWEAIIGQLYVAIFIARLMALYIAGDRYDRDRARDRAPDRDEE